MTNALWAGRELHFIGIGGAGMSGLALVARSLGASVTGSDRAESSYVKRLRASGIGNGARTEMTAATARPAPHAPAATPRATGT